MGRFAVIGLGNFGGSAARTLFEAGHEVICLDRNEALIKAAQKFSTYGLVGRATDPGLLKALKIETLDAVFISLGDSMADSILVTLHLKDLRAKRIVAKIISEDHGRILKKVGASDVVFPERDTAVRVATYVSSPTIMDYLDLSPDYAVSEVAPSRELIGKSLIETRLRSDYGINVIAIRDVLMDAMNVNPQPTYVIKDSDVLVVIGHRDDLARMARMKKD